MSHLSSFLTYIFINWSIICGFVQVTADNEQDWQTFGSKQYLFILDAERSNDETRNQAAHECRRMNSYLVSVENSQQLDFIKHEIESRVSVTGQEFAHEQWWTSGRRQLGKWIWNDEPDKLVNTAALKFANLPDPAESPEGDFLSLEFQHEKWCLRPTPKNFRLRFICEKVINFLPTLGQEGRLIKNILSGYERDSRGSAAEAEPTVVNTRLEINHIHSLEENVLITTTSIHTEWQDNRLKWYPVEHKNITHLVLKTTRLWTPLIEILNGVGHDDVRKIHNEHVQVSHLGTVSWLFKSQLHTACFMSTKQFPFDQHQCHIDLGIALYPELLVNMTQAPDAVALSSDIQKGSWRITKTFVSRNKASSSPQASLSFMLVLQRQAIPVTVSVMVPITCMTLLSLLLWWIPYRGSQRTWCCFIILAIVTLFQCVMSHIAPSGMASGYSFTLLNVWFGAVYILLLYSACASVMLVNMIDNMTHKNSKHSVCTKLIWKLLPKSSKIPLLPIPEKPHKHLEENENNSNELDILRAKLLYADKVGFCDSIQTTNIDEVELGAKLQLVHSSSQTEDIKVNSSMACDKIYTQNFNAAIANVDRALFFLYILLLTLFIAVIFTVLII